MNRKILSFAIVIIMVLALALPSFAAPAGYLTAGNNIVKTDKKGYDSFTGKEYSSNNSNWTIANGVKLVSDNKTKNAECWYFDVADGVKGTIEVAYKISSNYYIASFAIDGAGKYYIGDAKGNNGVNMVKVGAFVEPPITDPIVVNLGFIGYYLFEGNVLSTSIHWQNLEKEGDMIDWEAVDAAYAAWVAQGGLEPDRKLWQTSGYASFTFEDYAAIGHGDFNIGQLENYYKAYYVDPGYILHNTPVVSIDPMAYFIYSETWTGNTGRFDFDIEFGEVIPIDWDEIYASYSFFDGDPRNYLQESYFGLTNDKVSGWWTGGVDPQYYEGARPNSIIAYEGSFDTFFFNNSGLNVIALWPVIIETPPVDVCDHEFINDTGVVLIPRTCTEDGLNEAACSRAGCDAIGSRFLPALGHNFEPGQWKKATIQERTCIVEGIYEWPCDNVGCTEVYKEIIPGYHFMDDHGNDWSCWVWVDEAATCEEDGFSGWRCKYCDKEDGKVIPACDGCDECNPVIAPFTVNPDGSITINVSGNYTLADFPALARGRAWNTRNSSIQNGRGWTGGYLEADTVLYNVANQNQQW